MATLCLPKLYHELGKLLLQTEFAESDLFETVRILNIAYVSDSKNEFLAMVSQAHAKLLEERFFSTDLDQFKLHELRVKAIDNVGGYLYYEGGFWGDHGTDMELMLLSWIEFIGIPWSVHQGEKFYRSLLAESYHRGLGRPILSRRSKGRGRFSISG